MSNTEDKAKQEENYFDQWFELACLEDDIKEKLNKQGMTLEKMLSHEYEDLSDKVQDIYDRYEQYLNDDENIADSYTAFRNMASDGERGEKTLNGSSLGGKNRSKLYQKRREKWQELADEVWLKKQHLGTSGVARIIARKTGDKFETIRKNIKKPD